MDKRTLLAVMISLGIYYAWMVYKGPPPIDDTLVIPRNQQELFKSW